MAFSEKICSGNAGRREPVPELRQGPQPLLEGRRLPGLEHSGEVDHARGQHLALVPQRLEEVAGRAEADQEAGETVQGLRAGVALHSQTLGDLGVGERYRSRLGDPRAGQWTRGR